MKPDWLKETLRMYAQFRRRHPELISCQKRANALGVEQNFLWRLEREPDRNVGYRSLNIMHNALKKELK